MAVLGLRCSMIGAYHALMFDMFDSASGVRASISGGHGGIGNLCNSSGTLSLIQRAVRLKGFYSFGWHGVSANNP